ncbi:MAG: DNA methyltransferase, partial [Armatimonadetes bacterium]|nr:DNA methyltransferase [Armatimonadota bacterium]
ALGHSGQLTLDYPFPVLPPSTVTNLQMEAPQGYKGLHAFHKYWGKKPIESLAVMIERLTESNDIVIDPFVGSGFVGREAVLRNRRFIGVDINPIAVELSRLILDLPDPNLLRSAALDIESRVRESINNTYSMAEGGTATHYLWKGETLQSVWTTALGKRGRQERQPNPYDEGRVIEYENYVFQYPRPLRLFHNSRINTSESITLDALFTGRARHNIDLLLHAISLQPTDVQNTLKLALTSASGQMSRMVFAITGRGKMSGVVSEKVEVGSWVIGYWRPELHFEVNVWNCFQHRVSVMLKALNSLSAKERKYPTGTLSDVLNSDAQAAILEANAKEVLSAMPSESASLIITDPPHGDRIPYLELSEMWNALLGKAPALESEIVVSNARGRGKSKSVYSEDMRVVLQQAGRVLKSGKFLAVLFNARDSASWEALSCEALALSSLCYKGSFPLHYSANSVVQDNRKGGLKTDFVLLYQKSGGAADTFDAMLQDLPGWSERFPTL